MHHGLAAATPVAVVRHGTLPTQATLLSTLDELPSSLRAARIEPPAIIIVGSVVGLRAALDWYP
jgi:siroheme synthase